VPRAQAARQGRARDGPGSGSHASFPTVAAGLVAATSR
jgi:hypothetical protein